MFHITKTASFASTPQYSNNTLIKSPNWSKENILAGTSSALSWHYCIIRPNIGIFGHPANLLGIHRTIPHPCTYSYNLGQRYRPVDRFWNKPIPSFRKRILKFLGGLSGVWRRLSRCNFQPLMRSRHRRNIWNRMI